MPLFLLVDFWVWVWERECVCACVRVCACVLCRGAGVLSLFQESWWRTCLAQHVFIASDSQCAWVRCENTLRLKDTQQQLHHRAYHDRHTHTHRVIIITCMMDLWSSSSLRTSCVHSKHVTQANYDISLTSSNDLIDLFSFSQIFIVKHAVWLNAVPVHSSPCSEHFAWIISQYV